MKLVFVVHGFVQGVGYRYFVKKSAERLGVKGLVKNQDDGAVLIVAESDQDTMEKFEAAINVCTEHGVQVLRIEKFDYENGKFPDTAYDAAKFVIKK